MVNNIKLGEGYMVRMLHVRARQDGVPKLSAEGVHPPTYCTCFAKPARTVAIKQHIGSANITLHNQTTTGIHLSELLLQPADEPPLCLCVMPAPAEGCRVG